MNAAIMLLERKAGQLILIVNGRGRRAVVPVVPVVPRRLLCSTVTTRSRVGSLFIRRECRVHVVPAA